MRIFSEQSFYLGDLYAESGQTLQGSFSAVSKQASQILQVNTRWKALAEIYTMDSFAPFWNPKSKSREKRTWPKQPSKRWKWEAHKQQLAT